MTIYILELLGVGVSAVSGALAAGRKHLDLLGVIVVGVVNAVGGGTLRDVLLDRHPVFWIEHPTYLYVILGATLLTVIHAKFFKPPYRSLLIADAFGLALFSISGAQIAEQAQLRNLLIVVMGTMTGTAGGLLRDVLLADIPVIFTRSRIYATAAIVGVMAYLLLQGVGLAQTWAALLAMTVVVSLRMAAIIWGLMLPIFSLSDTPPNK